MDRSGWGALVVVAVFSLLVAPSSVAHAQAPGEELARRAFEEGVAFEKKGDYASALTKFEESARIKATLGNRFHVAYCLEMLGKLAAAAAEYEKVESDALEQKKPEIVDTTRARLEPLRARVPQLSLRIVEPPDGVEVLLDDAPVALALLDGKPFRIEVGEHTVRAHAPEHVTFTKTLTAGEGDVLSLDIQLAPSRPAPREATAPTTSDEPLADATGRAPKRTAAIAVTGGAVALLAGGFVAFAAAKGAHSEAEKSCPLKISCESEKTTVRTLDAVALGGFIGGASLAALSVVLWTSKPTDQATASSRVVARPSWVGVEGRF